MAADAVRGVWPLGEAGRAPGTGSHACFDSPTWIEAGLRRVPDETGRALAGCRFEMARLPAKDLEVRLVVQAREVRAVTVERNDVVHLGFEGHLAAASALPTGQHFAACPASRAKPGGAPGPNPLVVAVVDATAFRRTVDALPAHDGLEAHPAGIGARQATQHSCSLGGWRATLHAPRSARLRGSSRRPARSSA